jgi:hypothetical protein
MPHLLDGYFDQFAAVGTFDAMILLTLLQGFGDSLCQVVSTQIK